MRQRTERNAAERESFLLLCRLLDHVLLGNLLALRDMLKEMRRASVFFQTVNVLPNEVLERQQALVQYFACVFDAAAGPGVDNKARVGCLRSCRAALSSGFYSFMFWF